MNAKWAHVRRLMDEGYEMEAVDSDRGAIDVTFRKGIRRIRIRFGPGDAEALLLLPNRLPTG